MKIEDIRSTLADVFAGYSVAFCYLFGSYAKGKATESSDVDLLISADVTGMRFFGLVGQIRESLHKKVDVLDPAQLKNNPDLLNEILKDGIKVYGRVVNSH